MKTKKRLKTLSITVCFIFALSASPVLADYNSSAHAIGAGSHGKSEGSQSKKHHSSYSHHKKSDHKQSSYSHEKKHAEGSKGRTWGRGTYKKGHGHSSKHSGHYEKDHHSSGGHSKSGYGQSHSGSKHHYAKAHCASGSFNKGHGHKSSGDGKHGGHSHYKKDPFAHVLKYKCQLGLKEAQISEIKNQQFEFVKVSIRSHAAHKIAHMELDRVIHSENVDEAKARQLAEVLAETKTRKIKAMVEGKLAVMRILTADQKRIITRMYNRHN
jgi:Spy/CpxP family protein refolding chaperone